VEALVRFDLDALLLFPPLRDFELVFGFCLLPSLLLCVDGIAVVSKGVKMRFA
jgi:hypothetical protein